ncbi:MAG: MerR family transcriptional regulator [Gemmatimonadales bacterium]
MEDPLFNIREYRKLAPWNLRDLATVAGAILDASGVRPINAAASAHPTERTIRFYVTRSLVMPPDGRGTAATYTYRHLLHVLAIKLRQMEGVTLADIGSELTETTGDVMERRVAAALGPDLPPPSRLPLTGEDAVPRGRAGQALRAWTMDRPQTGNDKSPNKWHRVPVADGLELHVREDHLLARHAKLEGPAADAVRLVVGRILSQLGSIPSGSKPTAPAERTTQRV